MDSKWDQKIKNILTIVMGLIATWIAILFPMVITLIDPDISISIGGTNLGVIFILSSPMIGYYIGEMLRSEEDAQLNTKSAGFALCGVFIGFLTIIILNIYYQVEQFDSLIVIGLFGFGMAMTTFLANVTDFIKNRQFSEEKFKNIISFVGIIGFYQYLVSSYIAPILKAPITNSVYFVVFFLLIAVILGLFFLREIRGLIPEALTDYIKDYIEFKLHTRKKLQGSQGGINSDINENDS